MDGWKEGMVGLMDGWIDGQRSEGWMNIEGGIDGWIDRGREGWMDRGREELMKEGRTLP